MKLLKFPEVDLNLVAIKRIEKALETDDSGLIAYELATLLVDHYASFEDCNDSFILSVMAKQLGSYIWLFEDLTDEH
jgi:hypothetical protein